MSIWQLVVKEIHRRKLNFISGLISVALSVAVLVGSLTMLKAHDMRTGEIVAQKEKETRQRMAVLEDDYRKIMKYLGFNLLILPRDQKLGDLYTDGFASRTMPEEYATRLSKANIVTIRHLLPSLQQKIKWPEKQRTIVLMGTRGEVASSYRDDQEPILVAVPKGRAVIGYELAASMHLRAGEKFRLLGRTFTIEQCNEERGTNDDITIWIDLQEAQGLLGKPGKINAILALKCLCAGNDIAQIRQQIGAVLPGVQVIEQGTKVLTRAEARKRAAKESAEAVTAEIRNRQRIRREQEAFSAILVPLVFLASGIWIGLIFLSNVRERKSEIGILSAIGVQSRKVLSLFLMKALLMGAVGAVVGYITGTLGGMQWQGIRSLSIGFDAWRFILSLLMAVLLALTGSWIPAFLASRQDPADVLREE